MPPHGYIHVLSLTENITEFEKAVHRQKISGNIDTPEGGFDAMLQAAVCEVRSFILLSVCSDIKFPKNLWFLFGLWSETLQKRIHSSPITYLSPMILILVCVQDRGTKLGEVYKQGKIQGKENLMFLENHFQKGCSFHSLLSKEEPGIACCPTHVTLGSLSFVNLACASSVGTPEVSCQELVWFNGCGRGYTNKS